MSFTPFHLGPNSWIGLILFKFLDFPVFLFGRIIVDIKPFAVMFFGLRYPLHEFFHRFSGGSIIAVLVALALSFIRFIATRKRT